MASVALANGLNANLLRRWVVTEERAGPPQLVKAMSAAPAPATVASGRFLPLELLKSAVTTPQEITIELRRGATVVKVAWPLAAVADCAGWLRELLR